MDNDGGGLGCLVLIGVFFVFGWSGVGALFEWGLSVLFWIVLIVLGLWIISELFD